MTYLEELDAFERKRPAFEHYLECVKTRDDEMDDDSGERQNERDRMEHQAERSREAFND